MIELKSFLLGKKSGGGSSESAKEVDIFSEQDVSFTSNASFGGLYANTLTSGAFPIEEGKEYKVEWDGANYTCIGFSASFGGMDGFGIGNASIMGVGENTSEPFIFGYVTSSSINVLISADAKSTHKIRIYQIVENAGRYSIQSKSVNLSMAEGSQNVSPDEGYLLSDVTINKPATLIPENIAEGIDIGGVIGSLASSGSLKIAMGTIQNDLTEPTAINHNLGVIPDIVFYMLETEANSYYSFALGMSTKFSNLVGFARQPNILTNGSGAIEAEMSKLPIDGEYGCIRKANETSFTLYATQNSSFNNFVKAGTKWVAIAGLV